MEKDDTHTELEFEDDQESAHQPHIHFRRVHDSGTDSDSVVERHEKLRWHLDKDILVTRPVNDCFLEAPDYRTYSLADKASFHYDEVV